MNPARDVSHALLLDPSEVDPAQLPETLDLSRPFPTALRGPVALADPRGTVFARGTIEAVVPHEASASSGPGTYRWRLIELEAAPRHFPLRGRLIGPAWARLSFAERQVLAGQLDDADQFGRGAEPSDETAARNLAEADADHVVEGFAPETDLSLDDALQYSNVPEEGDQPDDAFVGPDATIYDDAETNGLEGASRRQIGSEPNGFEPLPEVAKDAPAQDDPAPRGDDENSAEFIQEPPLRLIEAARERAMAFVPEHFISEDAARAKLIELREKEIKRTFPNAKANAGLLRKTLLDRLIDEAVEDEEDFERLIPREVRVATDPDQIAAYLSPIVQILAKIR